MDAEGLKLKIDSKAAQADLAALSKVLDRTSASAEKLDKAFSRSAANTDANLSRAARSMEKYAQVANLLSKIKVAGNPAVQVQEMAKALDAVGRARGLSNEKVASIRAMGHALQGIRVPERMFAVAGMLNALGSAKIPTQAQAANLHKFFTALSSFKGTTGGEQVSRLLNMLSNARAPSAATIDRLQKMFHVLAGAKDMPGATRIANQLDTIAAAANRASRALNGMPNGGRGLFSAGAGTPRSTAGVSRAAAGETAAFTRTLREGAGAARVAEGQFTALSTSVSGLTGRFRLGRQAGTIFSTMFASFTAGQFIRSLYDANISLLKLQKGVLFATGTFEDASRATDTYIGMSMELGLSIKDNIDTYGRFVIASKASNVSLNDTNAIYHALGQAMTVVGSSANQQRLAFYGLTEMLQKGIVYSKEFNRQIGAQLPGNAILGARALSKLEHRVVSVSEFFQKMHSGTLLSPGFVPAWAAEVEKTYHPLLALAQARPDVALARLNNAFFIFARQVGQGSFMTAISRSINDIMAKFITMKDGVASLTPEAKHLADTLGSGLASALHMVGNGLSFIIDHFDSLFAALKGFLAFKLAEEFLSISTSILKATASMTGFGAASRIVATEEASVATEARVAVAAQTGGTTAAATIGGLAFGRRAPASAFQRAASVSPIATVTRRSTAGFNYAAAAQALPITGMYGPPAPVSMLSGPAMRQQLGYAAEEAGPGLGSRIASTAIGSAGGVGIGLFNGITGVMGKLVPVAMGAAVALAIFSDKLTGLKTATGNAVTYGDLTAGALTHIGDSIGGWIKGLATSGSLVSKMTASDVFGRFVASTLAAFKTIFSFPFALASSIGRVIGTFVAEIVNIFVRGFQMIKAMAHGDFAGAARIGAQGFAEQRGMERSLGTDVKSDFSSINFPSNLRAIYSGAASAADHREANAKTDESTKRNLEASLRQQNAAAIIEAAAQKFENATVGMDQIGKQLDPKQVLADLRSFGEGNLAAGATPELRASLGAGGNSDIKSILAAASAKAGIDPTRLYALGMAESSFDPKQYGWGPGHHAAGPFQMMPGTVSDLEKQLGYKFDPMKVGESAFPAATYLKQADAAAQAVIHRTLTAAEGYIPYVMGPSGGAKFLNKYEQFQNSDNQKGFPNAASLFPKAALQHGNESLFYAKDAGGHYTTPLTMGESYAQFVQKVSKTGLDISEDPTGPLGGSDSAANPAQGEKLNKTALEAYKKVQGIIGKGSPAAAAQTALQDELEELTSIRETLAGDLSKESPFAKTFLADQGIMQGITHAIDELKRKAAEAADPIGTLTKYQNEANQVTALRVRGLTDEADWQEQVNKAIKEGYTLDQIGGAETRKKNEAAKDFADTQAVLLEQTKQLNELQVSLTARISNNPVQNLIDEQILAHAKSGESLEQARQNQANQIATYTANAQNKVSFAAANGALDAKQTITGLTQSAGLNSREKSEQTDYIAMLQKLTGSSSTSLKDLGEAADKLGADASKNIKDIAASYAKVKNALENPPGFQRWVDALKPISDRMEDIKANFAEGLSSTLTDLATGKDKDPKAAFVALADQTRQEWMKAQMDNMLGGIFKGMGIAGPMKPEDKQMSAATTFSSAVDRFVAGVNAGAHTVPTGADAGAPGATGVTNGAAAAAAGAPPSGATAAGNGTTTNSPPTGITNGAASGSSGAAAAAAAGGGIPALRGSLDTGTANSGPTGIVNGTASSVSDAGATSTIAAGAENAPGTLGTVWSGTPVPDTRSWLGKLFGGEKSDAMNYAAHPYVVTDQGSPMYLDPMDQAAYGKIGASYGGSAKSSPFTASTGLADFTGAGGANQFAQPSDWAGASGGNAGAINAVANAATSASTATTAAASSIANSTSNALSQQTQTPPAAAAADASSGGGFWSNLASLFGIDLGALNGTSRTQAVANGPPAGGAKNSGPTGIANGDPVGTPNSGSKLAAAFGNTPLAVLGVLGPWVDKLFQKTPPPTFRNPNGVIGQMSTNTVSGTTVAPQANLVGTLLNFVAQNALGNANAASAGSANIGSYLGNMASNLGNQATSTYNAAASYVSDSFDALQSISARDGYAPGQPVMTKMVSARTFRDVPHYASGTGNTSGIPAIVHPNEAVIPLSGNRKIPVDMGDTPRGATTVNSNITVISPDADSFRMSGAAIQREQNRTLRRAAIRNLTISGS